LEEIFAVVNQVNGLTRKDCYRYSSYPSIAQKDFLGNSWKGYAGKKMSCKPAGSRGDLLAGWEQE